MLIVNRNSFSACSYTDKTENLNKQIEILDKIISNFSYLDSYTKFQVLNTFCTIYFKNEDFMNILNLKLKTNFEKIVYLKSHGIMFNGSPSYFIKDNECDISYSTYVNYNENNAFSFICAAVSDFKNKNDIYDCDSIKDIILNRKIYPISMCLDLSRHSVKEKNYNYINTLLSDEISSNSLCFGDEPYIILENNNMYFDEIMKVIETNINPILFLENVKTELLNSKEYFEFYDKLIDYSNDYFTTDKSIDYRILYLYKNADKNYKKLAKISENSINIRRQTK